MDQNYIFNHPLDHDDILYHVVRAMIKLSPIFVGSCLSVNKKWNKAFRQRRVWQEYGLENISYIVSEIVDYTAFAQCLAPLIEAELDERICYFMELKNRSKKHVNNLYLRQRLTLPRQENYKQSLIGELNHIRNRNGDLFNQFILPALQTGGTSISTTIFNYQRQQGLTIKQTALLLVLCSLVPNIRSTAQFSNWKGVKHVFKSQKQLNIECDESENIQPFESMMERSSQFERGLHRPKFQSLTMHTPVSAEMGFKRILANSFVLSNVETHDSVIFTHSYISTYYVSWLSFLPSGKWIALFDRNELDHQDSLKKLIMVEGNVNSDDVIVDEFFARLQLPQEFTEVQADQAIKTLYEFSDAEWELIPTLKYSYVLQTLSGSMRDVLEG